MSSKYDIAVAFDDGQVMIFKQIDGFKYFPESETWRIITCGGDYSFINAHNVRFIGHKYVWDKMKSDNTIKVEEEQPVPSYIPGARTCRNCYHQGLCNSYDRFKDSSYAEICADYKKDF